MGNADFELRCNSLRHDLKSWEKNFALQHDGRRAGRDDIKADAVISQKYKEYNKLRDVLSSKGAPQTPSKRPASRKTSHYVERTPKANSKQIVSTPSKRKREEHLTVEAVDSGAEFLSPQGPSVIGPTPQRDGIVLGLFDLLPQGTPSKERVVLGDVALNVLQTPSKRAEKAESEASLEPHARGERTPLSSGKRFMLDRFVTPKKRKLEEEGTPTSVLKGFATPAFLRRENALGAIDEVNEPTPRPAPWKRGGLVRSLSSMIRSMQKQEDDRLDEEANIMREIELEEQGISVPKKPKIPEIQVEDSQAAMPLGPDRGLSDGEDDEAKAEEELGPDGRPKKVWKKKGPKRQTRRVIMRPNFAKPKPPPTLAQQEDSANEQNNAEDAQTRLENGLSGDDFSEGDDDGSDYASDDSHTPKKRKTSHKKTQDASTSQPKQSKAMKMETVKTAARKIKATAHANYRRLNIKSKAGNGGKGRFGRRR